MEYLINRIKQTIENQIEDNLEKINAHLSASDNKQYGMALTLTPPLQIYNYLEANVEATPAIAIYLNDTDVTINTDEFTGFDTLNIGISIFVEGGTMDVAERMIERYYIAIRRALNSNRTLLDENHNDSLAESMEIQSFRIYRAIREYSPMIIGEISLAIKVIEREIEKNFGL